MKDDRLIAFVHVPKTGGTSLEGVFYENAWPVFNIRHPDQARAFLELPPAEQDQFRAVFGHMPFGIDRHVARPTTYLTFLRDPVERVLSAFAHNLRHPDEPGADTVKAMGVAWLAQPSNFMCRFLADHPLLDEPDSQGGFWWTKDPPAFAPHEYLAQAKANLDRCEFVGLTETYDDDLSSLCRSGEYDLRLPPQVPRLKTSGREKLGRDELLIDQFEAIRAANHLDVELYDYALALRRRRGGPHRDPTRNRGATPAAIQGPEGLSPVEGRPGPTDLRWRTLPDQQAADPEALVFEMPLTAYGYGAASGILRYRHCRLRVKAEALRGEVGLLLTTADGSVALTEDQALTPAMGAVDLVWTITPSLAPAILVARNLDPGSSPATLRVENSEYFE